MIKKLIWNDIKQNKLLSAATVFFMAASAMLLALTVLLFSSLLGAIDGLIKQAEVPDFMQMHAGEFDEEAILRFAEGHPEIKQWQVCRFLNLKNSQLSLGDCSLFDSTQDNGISVQGQRFDFLLDMENKIPKVLPGEVYVPACYRSQYNLAPGDTFAINGQKLVIAGFLRDAQMNSMMASSKRFLVDESDYKRLLALGEEEYLIEFLLQDGTDTDVFATAYAAQGLPANGPAITKPLIRMINALSDGTMIFVIFLISLIVLLISLLCIRFILLIRMERDRKEVGMLKGLGIGKREIKQLYFSKYILFSGCGGLIGLLGAFLLKNPLAKQIQELYGTADKGLLTGSASLLAVALAEGIILFSIWRCLKKTDRLSVLEALFSLPEQERKRDGGYILIGIVVAACTFLMLVPQNLYSTLSSPEFVTYMGIGDGELRMDVRGTEDIENATDTIALALKNDNQVEKYCVLRTKTYPAVLPDGKSLNLTVELGDHNVFPVSYAKGRPPKAGSEIALSTLNARELGLSVGDSFSLLIDGKRIPYKVCGIYSDITNGGKTAKAGPVQDDTPVIWSILYVSLKSTVQKEPWMEQYRQTGADVTDIADYVRETYGQTLRQIQIAAKVAAGIAVSVIVVVVTLFMRLIVEKNRYSISLHKALGFTSRDMEHAYLVKGLFPAVLGAVGGVVLGNLCGEGLCGQILKGFGADSFRFVIEWSQVVLVIPALSLAAAAVAVLAGISKVKQIRAYECCMGKE